MAMGINMKPAPRRQWKMPANTNHYCQAKNRNLNAIRVALAWLEDAAGECVCITEK